MRAWRTRAVASSEGTSRVCGPVRGVGALVKVCTLQYIACTYVHALSRHIAMHIVQLHDTALPETSSAPPYAQPIRAERSPPPAPGHFLLYLLPPARSLSPSPAAHATYGYATASPYTIVRPHTHRVQPSNSHRCDFPRARASSAHHSLHTPPAYGFTRIHDSRLPSHNRYTAQQARRRRHGRRVAPATHARWHDIAPSVGDLGRRADERGQVRILEGAVRQGCGEWHVPDEGGREGTGGTAHSLREHPCDGDGSPRVLIGACGEHLHPHHTHTQRGTRASEKSAQPQVQQWGGACMGTKRRLHRCSSSGGVHACVWGTVRALRE